MEVWGVTLFSSSSSFWALSRKIFHLFPYKLDIRLNLSFYQIFLFQFCKWSYEGFHKLDYCVLSAEGTEGNHSNHFPFLLFIFRKKIDVSLIFKSQRRRSNISQYKVKPWWRSSMPLFYSFFFKLKFSSLFLFLLKFVSSSPWSWSILETYNENKNEKEFLLLLLNNQCLNALGIIVLSSCTDGQSRIEEEACVMLWQ